MRFRALLLAFVLAPLAARAAESTAVSPQQPAPLTSADERAALRGELEALGMIGSSAAVGATAG